jgi:hemerythrin
MPAGRLTWIKRARVLRTHNAQSKLAGNYAATIPSAALPRATRDEKMQWKDEYAIGIPEIDSQHRTLFEFITEFEKAVAGKVHWNTVQPLIVRAREFVKFHFAVEESLMQIVNYPQLIPHRAEHRFVLQQFTALEQRVLRQEMKGELLPLLSSWLVHHMKESDKPFGQFAMNATRSTA